MEEWVNGLEQLLMTEVEVTEVDGMTAAIAGLNIEYVRTDRGIGPTCVTVVEANDLVMSVGRMGFSATANTEIPDGLVVFGLITQTPSGGVWCGTHLEAGQLFIFTPGTTFVGMEPTSLAATLLIVPVESLAATGAQLGIGEPVLRNVVEPVSHRPETARLVADLWAATARPTLVEQPLASTELLESAVRAFVEVDTQSAAVMRRLDRREIVSDCLDFVESSGSNQPSMSELSRAANASGSSVRQAFVEVFDMPPTQYFRYRLLSTLRIELLRADPRDETVTRVASSLGVTHFGRTSGRYRAVFGEVPSQTLLSTV